jgi:hypothetical protein
MTQRQTTSGQPSPIPAAETVLFSVRTLLLELVLEALSVPVPIPLGRRRCLRPQSATFACEVMGNFLSPWRDLYLKRERFVNLCRILQTWDGRGGIVSKRLSEIHMCVAIIDRDS